MHLTEDYKQLKMLLLSLFSVTSTFMRYESVLVASEEKQETTAEHVALYSTQRRERAGELKYTASGEER